MENNEKGAKMKKIKKPLIFVGLILLVLLINREFNLTAYFSDIEQMKTLLETNFYSAFFIYIIVTIVASTLLALPGITFAVIAGIVFGPIWGSLACLIATTIGASIAFLVSRFFLKDSIKPMLENNKMLKKLLFNNNKTNDVILLMITRLVPIFPYNIQNFAYGITDISFWRYTGLTFLFMIPGVGIYTIGSAGLVASGNKWSYFLIAGGLLALVSLVGIIIKKKYLSKKSCVILFTRIPSVDKGKTRLRTHLTGTECEILQEKFILETYSACKETAEDVVICFGNEEKLTKLKAIINEEVIYFPQKGNSIGEKMANAFEEMFAKGYEQVVLVGSDIPHILVSSIKQAFKDLENSDVVINPTTDGGYYLIGFNKLENYKEIFNIEKYGGEDVLTSTIAKIEDIKYSYTLGEKNFDIDVWSDLKALGNILDKNETLCAKSRGYISFLLEKEEHENISNSTNL